MQKIKELEHLEAKRKRAEEAFREQDIKMSSIFRAAPIGIGMVIKRVLWEANNMLCSMTGYSREELLGQNARILYPSQEDYDYVGQEKYRQIGEKNIGAVETRWKKKDGTIIHIFLSSTPLDPDDLAKGVTFTALDITDRKQAEEALRVSEENFRRSLSESPLGIRIVSTEGETLYANRATMDIFGFDSIEEWQTTPTVKRYTEQSYAAFKVRREKRRLGEDDSSEYGIDIVRKDGVVRHLQVLRKRVLWNGKEHYQVIYRDITDRKQAEEALKQSEERYRTIIEEMEEGYQEVDLAGKFTFFNESFRMIFGYGRNEILGTSYNQYAADNEIAKRIYRAYKRMYKTGDPIKRDEWDIVRKDGQRRTLEFFASLLRDSDGHPIGFRGIVRDTTDRKRAEEELKQSLEQLRRAMQTTIQVLVMAVEMKDPYTAGHQRRMTNLARTMAREMGLPPEKIEGLRMAGIIHDIGKITLPTELLSKPTKLSAIELSLIREHVRLGYDILKDVESPWPLAEIVLQHHERMDGSGYPRGLKVEEILIEARILAVADVVEAMASHRPYRPALGLDAALEEIEKNRGLLYDSHTVDTCLRIFREKGYQIEGA